jgi:hypothetical protein
MAHLGVAVVVEMRLHGLEGAWTDISSDVLADLSCTYGISGGGANDRVASTGSFTFQLNNSTSNSAGLLGYYSIGHPNCRSGFQLGAIVRLGLTYDGTTYYKFLGAVDSVTPDAGLYRSRRVSVTALDAIDAFAKFTLWGLAARQNWTSSELVQLLLDDVTNTYWTLGTGLLGISTRLARTAGVGSLNASALVRDRLIANGQDTYALALDNTDDRSSTTLSELARISASELGYAYMRGDTTGGGTFVWESRATRAALTTPSYVCTDTMTGLGTGRSRDQITNHVQVGITSREVGVTPEILYRLESVPSLQASQTVTFLGPYRDPNQSTAKIAGLDMIEPVASTDYAMNTAADGSGTDVTAQHTVTTYAGANGVRFDITNHSGGVSYVTLLQSRGTAIRFTPIVAEAEDIDSQNIYGDHLLSAPMPYQNDAGRGAGAAAYLLNLYKSSAVQAQELRLAGYDDTTITQVVAREVGDRVDVAETVSGVNAAFVIHQVSLDIRAGGRAVAASWTLAPLDTASVWLLGSSTLGETTRLAYL